MTYNITNSKTQSPLPIMFLINFNFRRKYIPGDLSQIKYGGSIKFPSSEVFNVEQITTVRDSWYHLIVFPLWLFSLYISPPFIRLSISVFLRHN